MVLWILIGSVFAWWPFRNKQDLNSIEVPEYKEPPSQSIVYKEAIIFIYPHGIFGNSGNSENIRKFIQTEFQEETIFHIVPQSYRGLWTWLGIQSCGSWLVRDIQNQLSTEILPKLDSDQHWKVYISFTAHSFGGYLARYAAGLLFCDECTLLPTLDHVQFIPLSMVTSATPHNGVMDTFYIMDYLDYSVLTWPFATYVVSSVNDFIAKTGKWLDKLSNPEHQFMKALKKFPFRTLVGAVDDGIVHPNSALVHLESHRDTCDSRIIPQGKFALHSFNGFECLNNNLICSEDIEQLYEKNLFDLSVFEYKHSSGILEAIYDIINGIHPANNTHYHEFNKGAKNKQLSENRVPKGSSLVIYKNFRTLSWRRILVDFGHRWHSGKRRFPHAATYGYQVLDTVASEKSQILMMSQFHARLLKLDFEVYKQFYKSD